MAPFASSLVSFFLLAPLLVSAAPSHILPWHIAGLPRDAAHLALDEHARELIAFTRSGENLGRFPINLGGLAERQTIGACATMSSDDVQKCGSPFFYYTSTSPHNFCFLVPGWQTLKDTAEKNWGSGKYNVVTNDKDVRSCIHNFTCASR
jgi:hypothetical protein